VRHRLAYGDVRLEAAAFAISRLDAALSSHSLLSAWTFWSQLDTARRHAETDGRRVDLYRLAAFLYGLPLRVGSTLSMAERGDDITALAYTVERRSWIVQPEFGQRDLLDSGLAHLRQTGAGQLALIGAALGLRDWIVRDGSRAAIRAALPFYLRERGITRQPLAPLTGSDALKPGKFDHATGFTVQFLEAVTQEAEDAHGLLWTMEREWRAARTVVSNVFAVRAASVVDDPQPDLSRAELKALLVIAYYQPVTHAEFGVILGREIPRERLAELRDLVAPGPRSRGRPTPS
jgi:chromosome segregation and condensation protein ScpB